MSSDRIWYPFTFRGRDRRVYRVSFRIAEEATWDHRFHDLDGREIGAEALGLLASDLHVIQASCDASVGSLYVSVPAPMPNQAGGHDHSAPAVAAAGSGA